MGLGTFGCMGGKLYDWLECLPCKADSTGSSLPWDLEQVLFNLSAPSIDACSPDIVAHIRP